MWKLFLIIFLIILVWVFVGVDNASEFFQKGAGLQETLEKTVEQTGNTLKKGAKAGKQQIESVMSEIDEMLAALHK